MHSPLITTEGGQRVDCCTANCNQGRTCPTRQACELPEESAGSLLSSRTVWLGAVLSVIAWGLVAGWLLT